MTQIVWFIDWMMQNREMITMGTQLVGVASIISGIGVYLQEKHRERREREYGTYNALDDKYIEFLNLALNHIEVGVAESDLPFERSLKLSQVQRRKQYILYLILISILERAYLMYRQHTSRVKRTQWEGWVEYMKGYAARPSFREVWRANCEQYDFDFMQYMSGLILEAYRKEIAKYSRTELSS